MRGVGGINIDQLMGLSTELPSPPWRAQPQDQLFNVLLCTRAMGPRVFQESLVRESQGCGNES